MINPVVCKNLVTGSSLKIGWPRADHHHCAPLLLSPSIPFPSQSPPQLQDPIPPPPPWHPPPPDPGRAPDSRTPISSAPTGRNASVDATKDATAREDTRADSCERELLTLWTENLKNTDAEGNIIIPWMLGNLMIILIKTLIETKDLLREVRDATRSGTSLVNQTPATLPMKPALWATITARNAPTSPAAERATATQ
ncbi:hypothetical protein CROQUDRAFT_95883 [Cronartium quercuum f. sp. fusiforme G11]|uniref:Uncharacterized protein n=1 Tax=Cronartium quercuum f. sp. fusiforme G11 TaxID=708437 RepID=A0A9P6NGK3_9BASI|nr:hypothetical protein CROQUDRAFT_95883 [Cronartium quercuum f. sp. fusiforme G11]